jgi:hypothetical protein
LSAFTSIRPTRRWCWVEKSQIQALDRTQPDLPMKKGRPGPRSMLRPERSLASACHGIVTRNSCAFLHTID